LANAAWISLTRSAVGAFWPGCFRVLFEDDDLDEAFFAALVEFVPEGFVELFLAVAEVVLRPFTGLLATDFLFGADLACEPWTEIALPLGAVLLFALTAIWGKLAGTPSPANEEVSRARSAARTIFISLVVPLSC